MGLQWMAPLKCVPADAFFRVSFDYQYWNTTDAAGINLAAGSRPRARPRRLRLRQHRQRQHEPGRLRHQHRNHLVSSPCRQAAHNANRILRLCRHGRTTLRHAGVPFAPEETATPRGSPGALPVLDVHKASSRRRLPNLLAAAGRRGEESLCRRGARSSRPCCRTRRGDTPASSPQGVQIVTFAVRNAMPRGRRCPECCSSGAGR